ncbi:DUF2703 domain-containing protein [Olivibacter sp. SDN3]|uniref:DUF2703 domain-containing protein n=1 Tax=unclassified Olivibacter TaxID=2632301 RepID=UPI0016515CB4|nr:DUF2703 domain-containing protein [Olivibacter sp. SDN3]QNL50278.1 DUF2703 domain-containing protein [Olivibacter sp. SDN3]
MDNVKESVKLLDVKLIQVDMQIEGKKSCTTCDKVHTMLLNAVKFLEPVFRKLDVHLVLNNLFITTIDEAEHLGISSSPTIRIGNTSLYPEHISSNGEERQWYWKGGVSTEPTEQMFIELIFRGYLNTDSQSERQEVSPYVKKFLKQTNSSNCCSLM